MPVEHAGHGFHVVDERGHQGFHAFDGNRVRDGLQHVVGIRNLPDEPFRPVPHGVGELQFTAGRRPDRADALAVGALVGRVEFSDGVDLVTEELDAHRMWRGWGKDVDDAAAHRELATVHHQVDARVGVLNQSTRHVVERQLLALREDKRIDVAEPLDNGLDQRTHRHDEYADRSEHRIGVAGVREPAEYGHAARHGVGTGTERSWGSVSQASSCAMSFGSPPYHDRSAFTVSSASRLEATTRTTGVCSACAAAMAGRNPSGRPR